MVIHKNELIFLKADNSVEKISFLSIPSLIKKLQDAQNYQLCAQLSLSFEETLVASLKQYNHSITSAMIEKMQKCLLDEKSHDQARALDHVICKLTEAESKMEEMTREMEKKRIERSSSGIYTIKSRTWSVGSTTSDNQGENEAYLKRISSQSVVDVETSKETVTLQAVNMKPSVSPKVKIQEISRETRETLVGFKGFAKSKISTLQSKLKEKLATSEENDEVVKTSEIISQEKANLLEVEAVEIAKEADNSNETPAVMVPPKSDVSQDATKMADSNSQSSRDSDMSKSADSEYVDSVMDSPLIHRKNSSESLTSLDQLGPVRERKGSISSGTLSLSSAELMMLGTAPLGE